MADRIYIELDQGEAEMARDALAFSLGFGGSDVPGADDARAALTKLKAALVSEGGEEPREYISAKELDAKFPGGCRGEEPNVLSLDEALLLRDAIFWDGENAPAIRKLLDRIGDWATEQSVPAPEGSESDG